MAVSRAKAKKLEKDAWEWCENVDCARITQEHLKKAYRVNLASCDKTTHKVNCRTNPNCLAALGEKCWMKELKDDVWYSWEDPETEKRTEGSFVGLKNLGATCYVNTFLQVWFHNVKFRSALYSWIPLDEPTMSQAPSRADMETDEAPNDSASSTAIGNVSPATTYNIIQKLGAEMNCDENMEVEHSKDHENTNGNTKEQDDKANQCPPIPDCTPWDGQEMPKSFCHHLQLLFAQLQYTSRRFIDPAPFVESLGLDKEEQQDAQEFCKLFLSLLEETLSQQPDQILRNIVQEQFGGMYSYITRCSNCDNQSQRNSKFYELDLNIQGHGSLSQCIKEFLKKEDLRGDNQYYCSYCSSKQDATRYIKLQELPPVLNLQLLRFVFDRKTGYKKKLSNSIYFPEVLYMKDYVDTNLEGSTYDLTAVLIHRGLSAYSGHYVAHIKDKKSGIWYKFNDETIEQMKGKTLRLESEEDLHDVFSESSSTNHVSKKIKLPKGSSSKDAYMLVYCRQGDENNVIVQEPPASIQELVAKDNSKVDVWVDEIKAMQDTMAFNGRERQNEVQKVYSIMEAKKDYEWISTEWLRKWLVFDYACATPIDNSSLLCPHGRLNPDKVVCAKRISIKAAEFLFKRYGGLPRLKSDSFCAKCVKERCERLQFSLRLTEDQKVISKALKANCERHGFWVGKNSLRRWKTLAQLVYAHLNPKSTPSPDAVPRDSPQGPEDGSEEGRSPEDTGACQAGGSEGGSVEDGEKVFQFNEDVTCEHGCLSTSTTLRRLVPNNIWKRLKFYFDDAPEFPWRHNICPTCMKRDQQEAKRIEDCKKLAANQKSLLGQLYAEKERPEFDNESPFTCYVLSRTFYEDWKKFLRSPARCSRPTSICNKTLLCPHDGLLYQPQCEDNDDASSALVYVWGMEWNVLSQVFDFDVEIKIVKEVFEGKETYLITPECCVECNGALVAERFSEAETYERATIYVRKVTEDYTEEDVQAILESYSTSEIGLQENKSDKNDTPFVAGNTPKAPADENRRRSSRHRRQRGEVVLTVDSSDTVRDLKLKLMKHFSVMPLDQHLSLINGQVLTDDTLTVGAVGIRPGSILILKVDEPQEGIAQEEMAIKTRQPEEGFKGTSLLKHTPMTI